MKVEANRIETVEFKAWTKSAIPKVLECAKRIFPDAYVSVCGFGVIDKGMPDIGFISFPFLEGSMLTVSFMIQIYTFGGSPFIVIHNLGDWEVDKDFIIYNSDDIYTVVMRRLKGVE